MGEVVLGLDPGREAREGLRAVATDLDETRLRGPARERDQRAPRPELAERERAAQDHTSRGRGRGPQIVSEDQLAAIGRIVQEARIAPAPFAIRQAADLLDIVVGGACHDTSAVVRERRTRADAALDARAIAALGDPRLQRPLDALETVVQHEVDYARDRV